MPTHHALPGTLVLTIEKMPLPRAVKRMSVSIDNLEPEVYNRKLVRRQSASSLVARDTEEEDGFRGNATVSFNTGRVGTRTKLFPLPLQETMPGTVAPSDFQVHCIDCRTEGKIFISGELDIDSDFLSMNDGGDGSFDMIKVNTSWFQVTVEEDLRAAALLEVFFGGNISFPEIAKSLLPLGAIPLSPFSLGSALTIGPMLDLEIVFGLEAMATSANISFGTEITVSL